MDVLAEKRLVKKAKHFGLPTEPLLHAFRIRRILGSPKDWIRRKAEKREINENSQYAGFIDKKTGYRRFGPNDLPGIMEAVNAAARLYAEKASDIDTSVGKKSFFYNIATRPDLKRYPELLTFAQSTPLLDAATGYLDILPTLSALGVYFSPANESFEKSQMFHIDDEDLRQVKCFVNVNDVGVSNGPFTFIPADKSSAIRNKLGHHWRGPRLSDEELATLSKEKDMISLVGSPGSGAMVDTSSCLHFGSRCRSGYRLVIMIQYTRFPDVSLLTEESLRKDGNGVACRLVS